MTKSELKTGMIVKYRDDSLRMVMKDTEHAEKDILVGINGWASLDEYNEDLTYPNYSDIDIMYVYNIELNRNYTYLLNREKLNDSYVNDFGTLIWERKKNELTIKEIEEKLGIQNLKIIEE